MGASGERIAAEVIDLPGTYSLYPKSMDERVPFQVLCDPENELYPDLTIIIADGTNLKRSLFLCSQIVDLKRPAILVINMMDIVRLKGMEINFELLSEKLGITVIPMNARKGEGIAELKKAIVHPAARQHRDFSNFKTFEPEVVKKIREVVNVNSDYNAFLVANNLEMISTFDQVILLIW